jgi:hypothetical protein
MNKQEKYYDYVASELMEVVKIRYNVAYINYNDGTITLPLRKLQPNKNEFYSGQNRYVELREFLTTTYSLKRREPFKVWCKFIDQTADLRV